MRKIAIVGGGQAGLTLALGLLPRGYKVTVVSNRTAEQIRSGRATSSQLMFPPTLAIERRLGIDFWEHEAPTVDGLIYTLTDSNSDIRSRWTVDMRPGGPGAQSVDQRVKMSRWLEEFEKGGGHLIIGEADVDLLEDLAASNDLVIVAAGKGEISSLFERDGERSTFSAPKRALGLAYATGYVPTPDYPANSLNHIRGVGEYFVLPALSVAGPCHVMTFEGVVGGPMDCWQPNFSPEEHWETALKILATHLPWEYERAKNAQLADPNAYLAGRFPPTVRKPVATLPSGTALLGMGDVVVLNDPITGQGSNNAARCAEIYLSAIMENADRPFDVVWMKAAFDRYWDVARYITRFTNTLLGDVPAHVDDMLVAASSRPDLAEMIAIGFGEPRTLFSWWEDPAKAAEVIAGRA